MTSLQDSNAASQTVKDVNLLSAFLANSQIPSSPQELPQSPGDPSALIIAASAILHQPHTIFSYLQNHLRRTQEQNSPPEFLSSISTLVLTGGIGHSTAHLYSAIFNHPVYSSLPSLLNRDKTDLDGIPEARLLYEMFIRYYNGEEVMRSWNGGRRLRVIVEEASTNCGANATLSRASMLREGVELGRRGAAQVDDVIIIQDPTLSFRTKASFERVYEKEVEEGVVRFWTWPIIVPMVNCSGTGRVEWDEQNMQGLDCTGLWSMERFYGLILGEIPRLRDDKNGYGPGGKNFIPHVDVPIEVEESWKRLNDVLEHNR